MSIKTVVKEIEAEIENNEDEGNGECEGAGNLIAL